MTEVPKITREEAAALLVQSIADYDLVAMEETLADRGLMIGLYTSALGRAALANFEAERERETKEAAWTEMRANYRQACCADCCRTYGDENGFPDLVIPLDAWLAISPTGHEGGLLCPSCMCRRAERAGLKSVPARFKSGPFYVDEDDREREIRRKAIESMRERVLSAVEGTNHGVRTRVRAALYEDESP